MKIIRLTTFLDFGGVERRLINISYLQDNNEWIFCAINKGGFAETRIKQNNKRVECFNLPYKIPQINTILKLYSFFKAEKPDVVHTSGAEANFHGVLAAKLAGIPVVVAEEIGIPSQSKTAKKIFGLIYKLAHFAIGNSKPVINYLKNENVVPETKLRLVPNPIIFPVLSEERSNSGDKFRIVSVSRLEPVKNIESMLRVVAKLKAQGVDVQYTIIGDGVLNEPLRKLTADLGISDNVIFAGFKDNPYAYLLQSDLYVLTSFSEGFSNSLMEAMYCATPSLSTRVGSAEEVIKDGVNGWIVAVNDDDELMEKIKAIVQMPASERSEIGQRGKQTIVDNYSLQKHADLLMTLYSRQR